MKTDDKATVIVKGWSPQPGAPTFHMLVVDGPGAGTRRPVELRGFRIGKAASNDLQLNDPTVSRFHAVIERTQRGLLLRDLGSTNGTMVGGTAVKRAYLSPLVPIQIGGSTLHLITEDAPGAVHTPTIVTNRMLGQSTVMQQLLA